MINYLGKNYEELPELIGSEKQVSWATQIRKWKIEGVVKYIDGSVERKGGTEKDRDWITRFYKKRFTKLSEITPAIFWINVKDEWPNNILSSMSDDCWINERLVQGHKKQEVKQEQSRLPKVWKQIESILDDLHEDDYLISAEERIDFKEKILRKISRLWEY